MVVAVLVDQDHLSKKRLLFQGLISGHTPALNRNRESGHFLLWKDYSETPNPFFKHHQFCCCFRIARHVFNYIREGVVRYDKYFECKEDALGKIGFSYYHNALQLSGCLHLIDEYIRMSHSTCLDSMYKFCKAMIAMFVPEHLREPNAEDIARLLAMNAIRGFPGMLGSIGCMHWEWKNCPSSWQGQYRGHVKACTIILEVVASQDLSIWQSFFGKAGSHNDINVLQRSSVFARLAEGNCPPVNVNINGHN
ncbi:uncharacterized protein [Aegilops tauschii subsp. strangulata]|uniref:uncharacterized protein n=1 Tax=Aegilops tauschii subsp. strangulata TaxID=200361 RepID=UPI001ABCA1EE|nr:uncharacterized protein LOC120972888 [Aegilops tauschii subsp. strangulata]